MKKSMILALALIILLGFATVTFAEETKAVVKTPVKAVAAPSVPAKAVVKTPAKKVKNNLKKSQTASDTTAACAACATK